MKRTTFFLPLLMLLVSSLYGQGDTLSFARPQKLSDKVNSKAEESIPLVSLDGKTLYFARTYHPDNMGGKYAGQDIWTSAVINGNYEEARKLTELNSWHNDVVVGTAKGGQRLYLINQTGEKKRTKKAGISRSDFDAGTGKWATPTAVPVPGLDVQGNFYSAYVGANEDFILWTLPGNGTDSTNNLYVSTSADKGESWSAPMALGGINSSSDDISPFFDESRQLLFWSTNGREGFGGYDIYYARRLNNDWKQWSEPVNAGPEINSPQFEAYLFAAADGTAWFCSNKNDSLSNVYISTMVATPLTETEEIEEEETEDLTEAETTRKPEKDPVLIIDTKDGSTTDRNLRDLSLSELLDKDTHIRFVYFPYDKYNITAKYIEVLDDVGRILDQYPEIDVLIEGHTDYIGSQAYNMVLSEARAQSTKEYLMIHGIEDPRILTKAYGKLQPYATNETEDGRALNRRVELYFKKR